MTRRLHACLSCAGQTRHRAVCGLCRRRGVTLRGDEIRVPITVRLLPELASPHAPTLDDLKHAITLPGVTRLTITPPLRSTR